MRWGMSERTLKPGWRMVKFGDVVHLNTEKVADPLAGGIERYVGLEHLTPEDLHIHTWGQVAEGTTFTNYFKPGQVLFGKRRAYQRKVAVADFAGVCSGDIYVFEPKDPETLIPELLPFVCQTEGFYEYAVGTSAGSLSPRTNWSQLANYEFPLPPLDEQRRVAEVLWAAEEAYENYLLVKRSCMTLLDAYLYKIISNTENPQIDIGSISKFSSGTSIKVTNLPSVKSEENPIPVFGGNGIAGYTNATLTTKKNVIVGRVGQFCGKVYYTTQACWITDNALYSVTVDYERVYIEYLAIILEAANLNKAKIGNYLPLINQKVIHSTLVPLPSLNEQKKIYEQFHNLKQALSWIEARLQSQKEFNDQSREYLLT